MRRFRTLVFVLCACGLGGALAAAVAQGGVPAQPASIVLDAGTLTDGSKPVDAMP